MKKLKLITETNHNVGVSSNVKRTRMYVEGIYSTAEVLNHNKRIYSKKILERAVDRFQEKIKHKMAYGQLGHPTALHSDPEKIAILTTKLEMKGNDVYGKSLVLDTPMGKVLKSILKDGQFGISSRGIGTVDPATKYVNEDYQLLAYDLVESQSNPKSFVNGVYEDKSWSLCEVRQILENEDERHFSQTGFDYHFVHVDNTPREFTECVCESCGEIQHVPSPLTCEQAICLQCDKEKSQFTKLLNIWTKRIRERNV